MSEPLEQLWRKHIMLGFVQELRAQYHGLVGWFWSGEGHAADIVPCSLLFHANAAVSAPCVFGVRAMRTPRQAAGFVYRSLSDHGCFSRFY